MHKLLSRALAVLLSLGFAASVAAQKTAKDIPVEDFFRRAQFGAMELSPDGARLAALTPFKGRNNLVVIDMVKRTRNVITAFDAFDVADFFWATNDRLCLRVGDGQDVTGRVNYRGSYCIGHDGAGLRDFTRFGQRGMTLAGRTYDDSATALVAMAARTRDSLDIYKLDTESGRTELLTFESPGRVFAFVLDQRGVPRIAVSQPERKDKDSPVMRSVWHRAGMDSPWEKLWEFPMIGDAWLAGEGYRPLAFDFDDTTLYVAHNVGRERMAVYRYDTKAKKMGELVFEHPLVDIEGGLVFSRTKRKLLGIRYSAEKPATKWFDEEIDKLQRAVDGTFKGTINRMSLPVLSDKWALVFSYSDTDPGQYHLLDRSKPAVETLVKTRPWLEPALMSERRFITYKARDGRTIPAWVVIPKGSSGRNLPLIVNVHGGPWVRSYGGADWGRWPEAQFFASRGYVVLEPEPRGSTGFGKSHFLASFRQWGQAMQDDINDGALHLVKEGIVDRGRMCIHGGSYGGYAAAMGVTRDPDLWKCATPFVAVTDLFLFQKAPYSDIARLSDFFETDFRRMVGDADADREMFTKYSPTKQARVGKAPVLLTMGSDDVRVPQAHGEEFKSALESAGRKVEYVVYAGEGHGYNKDENVFDFYRRLEKFFAEHLK